MIERGMSKYRQIWDKNNNMKIYEAQWIFREGGRRRPASIRELSAQGVASPLVDVYFKTCSKDLPDHMALRPDTPDFKHAVTPCFKIQNDLIVRSP